MPTCPECGRGLRTPQGLRGHLTFVHHRFVDPEARGRVMAQHLVTEADLSRLEQRISQVEAALGQMTQGPVSHDHQVDELTRRSAEDRQVLERVEQRMGRLQERVVEGLKAQRNAVALTTLIREELIPAIQDHEHELTVRFYSDQAAIDQLYAERGTCPYCGELRAEGRRTCGRFSCVAEIFQV